MKSILIENFIKYQKINNLIEDKDQLKAIFFLGESFSSWVKEQRKFWWKKNHINFFLVGPVGCGKTSLIKNSGILNNFGYKTLEKHYYEINWMIQRKNSNIVQSFLDFNVLFIDEFFLQDDADMINFENFLYLMKDKFIILTGNKKISDLCNSFLNHSHIESFKSLFYKNFLEHDIKGSIDYRELSKSNKRKWIYRKQSEVNLDLSKVQTEIFYEANNFLSKDIGPYDIYSLIDKKEGIFLNNLPMFREDNDDLAMRFRMVVDFCYFKEKELHITSSHNPQDIFQFRLEKYKRTLSRIIEKSNIVDFKNG